MPTYKIMTFNMRTQTPHDGENQFIYRRPFIKEFIEREKPDVIGTQEIQPEMYDALIEDLTDYVIVGGGRGNNYDNEAVCVAFRRDRFYLYDCETFWLSATPNKPGSRYSGDQSGCPRICTWVTLNPRDGKPFRFYNVHTDHVGSYARVLAANQVLQKISLNNSLSKMPCFITGDFNATPDDLCIKTMLEYNGSPLVDLSAESGQTFHDYGRRLDENCKIDYIFADADVKCLGMTVHDDKKGELYLSDHYPITAKIEL